MKKFRKGLCLFLTAAMLLSFLPAFSIGAFAAESDSTFDVWDGSVASGFAGGIGTEDDPYVIETAEQLAYFAKAVNSSYSKHCFENEFVVLKSNIDLNNRKWVPIGAWSSDHGFKGTFDGQGHVIKNLLVQSYSYYYGGTGFFGSANVIRNLGIINSEIRAHGNTGTDTGAIAGQANIVDGCYNTGMVAGDNNESYTGGIVGICYEAVVNCYNTGNIYGSGYRGSVGARGGIVGWARGSVINCFNTGDVTGLVKTGGIVGLGSGTFWGDGGCTIKNCYNTGDMIGTSTENPGGIAGETWENSTISNCYNSSTSYKCGIVGLFYSEGSTISNCY